MEENGQNESYALLQILAAPPFDGLGNHAITFAGEVDISSITSDAVDNLRNDLDDKDARFAWNLDIIVGPEWRQVKTVAPLVVVTGVWSAGTDEDDFFEFGIRFRSPKWTVKGSPGFARLVLHVSMEQSGEHLYIRRLGYTVTATGTLPHPEKFIP